MQLRYTRVPLPDQVVLLFAVAYAYCCAAQAAPGSTRLRKVLFNFTSSYEQSVAWSPVFADYNPASAVEGLNASITTVPGTNTKGWRFSISNRADDVYFGLKGLVKGLRKSTRLRIVFEVHIMSNAGSDCIGVGGSPGSSVWVKAGASSIEPLVAYSRSSGTWRFNNINKGEQSVGGPQGRVLGTVGVPDGACGGATEASWQAKVLKATVTSRAPPPPPACRQGKCASKPSSSGTSSSSSKAALASDKNGEAWLLVGAESGFEGINRLFITAIKADIYAAA